MLTISREAGVLFGATQDQLQPMNKLGRAMGKNEVLCSIQLFARYKQVMWLSKVQSSKVGTNQLLLMLKSLETKTWNMAPDQDMRLREGLHSNRKGFFGRHRVDPEEPDPSVWYKRDLT